MHQRDLADNTQNVREMCCHFLFVAHSQGVADGASLLHTTPQPTALNVLRPSPSPTARSTMQHERVTHCHSSTDRILSTATASSSRQVVLRNSFDAKVGARHGSTICCSTPELTRTATPAREKCMRPSCRTKVPKYVFIPSHAVQTTPFLHQQPDIQTSFPCEVLRRERATHRT